MSGHNVFAEFLKKDPHTKEWRKSMEDYFDDLYRKREEEEKKIEPYVLEIKSTDTKFMSDLIDYMNSYKTKTPEKTVITVK